MLSKRLAPLLVIAGLIGAGAIGGVAVTGDEPSRQEVIAHRGARVMPFSLDTTTHVFDATAGGGSQRVVAKDPDDAPEIRLIREHLRKETEAFRRGDFGDPAAIHGDDMPGLEALRAGYSDVDVSYRDLRKGAEIVYTTDDPGLATAIRAWFDAQLHDHAGDAASANSRAGDHTSHSGHHD